MGFGYKVIVFFCRNNGLYVHGQVTQCTKMDADKLGENTPNARKVYLPKLSAQKYQNTKPKSLVNHWKKDFIGCP